MWRKSRASEAFESEVPYPCYRQAMETTARIPTAQFRPKAI